MDVSAAGLSANGTTSDVATSKLAENFDTFLTLLTTQLKNQDPLEPQKSDEFVRQLVQFSEVEQSISTNKSLEQLLDLQTTSQSVAAMGYIGKSVEAFGNTVPLENGQATYNYAFDQEVETATVGIYNEAGNLVATAVGQTGLGKHTFVWDGLDTNGNAVPPGKYTIAISAKNEAGETVEAVTSVVGRVTGVESTADGVLLAIGGVNVPLNEVISVKDPVAAS